jgi:hypothetical protein
MRRHFFGPDLRRRWLGMVAGVASAFLAGPGPTTAAEITSRPVALRAPGQADRARAWGSFAFGMAPAEAHRAALRMGGQLVPAAGASVMGQPAAYHGPSQIRNGRQRRGDLALVWFGGGGLSRVTVMLFRLNLRSAEACLGAHRAAAASVLPSRGAPNAARVVRDPQGGLDEPGPHAGEAGDVVWVMEVQQSRARAVIETTWEAPVSAIQAGADETCIGTVTYLPAA